VPPHHRERSLRGMKGQEVEIETEGMKEKDQRIVIEINQSIGNDPEKDPVKEKEIEKKSKMNGIRLKTNVIR